LLQLSSAPAPHLRSLPASTLQARHLQGSYWDTLPEDLTERIHEEAESMRVLERARRLRRAEEHAQRVMNEERLRPQRESDERHAQWLRLEEKNEKRKNYWDPPEQNDNYDNYGEQDDETLDAGVDDPWADDDDTFIYRGRGGNPHRHKTFEAHPNPENPGMKFRPEHHLTGAQHAHAARRERTRNLHDKK
jgi:hypothetical protein